MRLGFLDAYEERLFHRVMDRMAKYMLEDVAEAAGLHFTTLVYWENGRTEAPRLKSMVAVAEVLGIRVPKRLLERVAKQEEHVMNYKRYSNSNRA